MQPRVTTRQAEIRAGKRGRPPFMHGVLPPRLVLLITFALRTSRPVQRVKKHHLRRASLRGRLSSIAGLCDVLMLRSFFTSAGRDAALLSGHNRGEARQKLTRINCRLYFRSHRGRLLRRRALLRRVNKDFEEPWWLPPRVIAGIFNGVNG